MAKTTSFNLVDHFEDFISTQIKSGRYGNASEVVRADLRSMEQEEQKLEALRHALIDGENSGDSTPLDMLEIIEKTKRRAGLSA